MFRIVLMVLRLFYIAPYYLYRIAKFGKSNPADYAVAYDYIRKVTKRAIRAGRVVIEAQGLENLPKEDGFIIYPNHQGLFDGLVFIESCPRPLSYVTKKEARNVLLLKQVGDALGAIAIDREDIKQSLQVINQVAQEVKNGRNFLIFAEGTRSKMGNKLLEFKGGSFKSATKAKCPIVPCALIDSFKPFDENSVKKVTVKLTYLPPLYYEEYKDMKTHEIAEEVKKRIEQEIARRLGERDGENSLKS